MSMKFALIFVVMLVSGVIVCGCTSSAPAMKTVKVAYQPTTTNGPLYIAQEEGYFAQQGIIVEFEKTQSPAAALPLLVHGDIAVSTGPLKVGLLNAVIQGGHIKIVADKGRVTPGTCTAYALMVRKDLFDKGIVRNVSDLKSRKVAMRDSDYDLYNALALGNLSRDDVETIDMDFTMIGPAFANGAIDAALVAEPYITQERNSGLAVVLVPGQDFVPQWPFPVYYGPAILDKDPDLESGLWLLISRELNNTTKGKLNGTLRLWGIILTLTATC